MFYKYHGCGNDFIITEYNKNYDYNDLTKKICNRYIGIGADTLIVVKEEKENYAVFFYNSDGSKAPMCGNGIRCAASYLDETKGVFKLNNVIKIKTDSGVRTVYKENNQYLINMGKPSFNKEDLSLSICEDEMIDYKHLYQNKEYYLNAVFMTTHHLIIVVDDLNITEEVGRYFCENEMFKKQINVNFVKIINRQTLEIKTYERGVGFTKACGSGTTAAVCVLDRKGLVDNVVNVKYEYGTLTIKKINGDFFLKGPAKKIAKISKIYN